MDCADFCDRLNDRLDHGDYADVDPGTNGLQVGRADDDTLEHVAFAVDGVQATATAAADAGADLLVVHHGMIWGGLDTVTGQEYDRIAALVEADLPLYVSHLPLDGHPELGNAARLADFLGCEVVEPFGDAGGVTLGQRARAADGFTVEGLRDRLTSLDTGGKPVDVLDFGPEEIQDVAIITGAGADWLGEAAEAGVDAFVTGEGKGKTYHEAREAGLNVFLAGHYATETFGVRALQDLAEEWGLETTFLEHPTGL